MNKRILAALLCMAMVLSLAPASASATGTEPAALTQVTAQEITAGSRLDDTVLPQKDDTARYDADTMVTVIVELQEASLLAGFEANAGSKQTIGQQVSDYLLTAADQRIRLEKSQDVMIAQLNQAIGGRATVTGRWTGVINAVAVKVPYGKLSLIREIPSVKNAYVEQVFSRPEENLSAGDISGIHGYSYNMTDLAEVWNAGYTGQGMLVAVLDTGLDLNYTTWGDFQTGIRQVHEAFTDESFLTDVSELELRYTSESLARFLQTTQLRATTGSEGQKIEYAGNALYKNLKVPYAVDYADGDLNVYPMDSDHGTHVSGTIAGYVETEEGEVVFSGVAPDAQILSMKVFSDSADSSGATESTIINALEDAMLLGADVVNLSLGSDNGFAEDDTAANGVYKRLSDAGIIFMVSAGNAGHSASGNHYDGNALAENPEVSMMAAPAVYENNLSIASINNTVLAQSMLTWTDESGNATSIPFTDPTDIAMKYQFAGQEPVDVILVDGYGTYNDYYNAGFRNYYGTGKQGVSGIALVKRGGGISFTDKVNMATRFIWSYYDYSTGSYVYETPIKAVIIYDEDPTATELIYMSLENVGVTACFISGVDGHAMAEALRSGSVQLTVQPEDEVVPDSTGWQMSSFSTWGAGPALELKPEITAPGGNIWSSLPDITYSPSDVGGSYDDYTGTYGMMSGTSMAAPHMSGIALLVEQAVRAQYGLTAKNAVAELTEHLLISTAVPVTDPNGVYYSPRLQGAGLVNAAAAITTPAYISVDGANVGKLELKDDPNRTGSYDLVFKVNNISDHDVTYDITATLTRPATDTLDTQFGTTEEVMLDSSVVLTEADLGSVTVPAGQTVSVFKNVTLTASQKAELDALFPNGIYVEGFVTLSSDSEPQIGLPVLAFYGDWTSAPIFDSSIWFNEPDDGVSLFNNASTMGNTFIGSYNAAGYINLGQNVFDPFFGDQSVYHVENFTLSPNGDGFLDSVNDFVLYQLREAKLVVVDVHDAQTGELYYRDFVTYQFKSLFYAAYGYAIPASQFFFTATSWDGTNLAGQTLPSGTQCVMRVTAYGDGDYGDPVYDAEAGRMVTDFESVASGRSTPTFNGHEMDMTGNVIEFPILVDTVAPKLENNTVSFYTEDGRTYLTGTVYDEDGSIASVEVHPYVKRTSVNNSDYYGYDTDQLNPFYTEHVYDPATKALTFTCDVTEYAHTVESWPGENATYTYEWTGHVFISCGDYGLNDRTYAVSVDTDPGLLLSQNSALLFVGSEFDLSVIDNTGLEGKLVRTSSNPEVATIDEFGKVTALAPGQTTITVTKGSHSAVCVVAVREPVTKVVDFKLAVDSFSGLKPNGTFIVRVTDLEPANVELSQVHWLITEDDPGLYEGLINVARYDTTGLAGEIYLNYTATGDPEIQVPGAGATLAVTLNGVTRTMHIDWEDLYTYTDDEDLVSAANFADQSIYLTQGETATLVAKYNNSSAHNVCDVALYTAVGATNYSYTNTTDPAAGLVLDGPGFAPTNSYWTGRLVNTEGYTLPQNIRLFTRYDYGDSFYEVEIHNYTYSKAFSYDPETGIIEVFCTPYSETNTLVIRADGVESEGTPAGSLSGETYPWPEGLYGPFDWTVTSGSGELTTAENVQMGYELQNLAYYTPSEPGVSYITATTKDGQYSVNFAVICQSVLPESLTLETKELTMVEGDTAAVQATVSPEPTLAKYADVTWTSYDPTVASVDPETGVITAHRAGYAYIRASLEVETGLETALIVHVVPCSHEDTTTHTVDATCTTDGSITVTCNHCGAVVSETVIPGGHAYETVTTDPTCTADGYTTYTCTVCGESHTADVIPAAGHRYEVIVVAPEGDTPGYTQHICTVCGYTYIDGFTAGHDCPSAHFTDVPLNAWYHDAVDFVAANGLMEGMTATTFAPGGTANRAQIIVVLYRMAGSPAVEGSVPFVDVAEGSWFYDAVLWAYQNGIAQGISQTHFAPGESVNRAQLVTFLYRFAADNAVVDTAVLAQFPDSDNLLYAEQPFAWAVSNGLVDGMDGFLNPYGTANRAQLATLLMRLMQSEN